MVKGSDNVQICSGEHVWRWWCIDMAWGEQDSRSEMVEILGRGPRGGSTSGVAEEGPAPLDSPPTVDAVEGPAL